MAKENIYAKGVMVFEKNAKAAEFVLGQIVITIDEFYDWCKEHPEYITQYQGKDQIRFDILKDKTKERVNLVVNNYKK